MGDGLRWVDSAASQRWPRAIHRGNDVVWRHRLLRFVSCRFTEEGECDLFRSSIAPGYARRKLWNGPETVAALLLPHRLRRPWAQTAAGVVWLRITPVIIRLSRSKVVRRHRTALAMHHEPSSAIASLRQSGVAENLDLSVSAQLSLSQCAGRSQRPDH